MRNNTMVAPKWYDVMRGTLCLKFRFSLLPIIFIFLLGTCAVNSLAAPDAALQISQATVESLLPLMFPDELKLTTPENSTIRINSVSLNLQSSPAKIMITGDFVDAREESSIPVSAEIALHISSPDGTLLLTPELLNVGPRYADIPLSEPFMLIKAWLLSAIAVLPDSITSISIPLQSQLVIAGVEKTIRSRQSIGGATADVVAYVGTSGFTVNLAVETVNVVNSAILVTFSANGSLDESAAVFPVGLATADANGLYIGGDLLAKVLTRTAGNVSIPFFLENPQGKIDGHSSNTVFGRQEWYIEFQGNQPLVGELQMQTSYSWNQQLRFSSQVSISAMGRIHGHGDPGPGGGCGVRPRAQLNGATHLEGVLHVRVIGGMVEFSVDAIDRTPVRLNYDVERVNFCGFTTQGPFQGSFDVNIPRNLATTHMLLRPLRGKITDNFIIKSTVTGSEKSASGYWILFEAERIAHE